MMENGPTVTRSASSAPLATSAVGWISTAKASGLHDHGGELALGGHLVAHEALARELEHVAPVANHPHRHPDHIARPHRLAEPAVVGGHEEDRLAGRVDLERLGHQHRAGLGHGLDQQHARHHWIVREVALEEGLVHGHALDADDGLVMLVFLAAVHEQHGEAVRDPRQHLGDVDHGGVGPRRRLARHASPPARRCAMRASHAVSLSQWRIGRAGMPPHVSPAGMSFITPAAAPTRAPAPMVTWSATPARQPNWAPSPIATLPEMPVWAAMTQFRPTRTLWAICTRLSILVFSPIAVSSNAPRSIVVLAPMETPSWMITRPSWGMSIRPFGPAVAPKPGSPMRAPDRIFTRSPIRANPMVTLGAMSQSRPMATPRPICAAGPTTTPGASTTPLSSAASAAIAWVPAGLGR